SRQDPAPRLHRAVRESAVEMRQESTMLNLDGKTAVVTGAGSGIGRGITLALAQAGANVLCADVVRERADDAARAVRELGRKAGACVADVRNKKDVVAMAEQASREFGALDICVANAGIGR